MDGWASVSAPTLIVDVRIDDHLAGFSREIAWPRKNAKYAKKFRALRGVCEFQSLPTSCTASISFQPETAARFRVTFIFATRYVVFGTRMANHTISRTDGTT